ncbi:MAG: transporter [Solirubrobacterales bacterium]|nr:transporter [Solirubrobacterales bacterium]
MPRADPAGADACGLASVGDVTEKHSALHLRWILILCCLAQFMVILDVSVVNVALPSIRADLGFSAVDLQWVVNAYTLTFAGFLLLGGRAADLLGHRRVFIGGLLLFSAASLAGGFAHSELALILARGAQGLGGAVVAPATLSILTTSFAEGADRNKALAAWGAMGGVGGAAGVLLGGALTDLLGWQSVLFINVPIGIAIALATIRFVPVMPPAAGERHYDAAGALTVTAGIVVVTFAIVRTDVNGWTSTPTLLVLAAGLALLAVFVAIESKLAVRPLVPLRIFASRTLTAANVVVFFLGCGAFAMWYFVSLYLQQVLGYSPLKAGVAFLPMCASLIFASTLASRGVRRFGPGAILAVGMTLLGIGLLLFSPLRANGTFVHDVLPASVVTAFGLGLSFVTVTISAVTGVQRADAGLASGLVNTSRQFGGSLGLAILATLASQRTAHVAHGGPVDPASLTAGFHVAFLVGSGFAFAGALVAALALARRPVVAPAATERTDVV